MVGTVQEEYGCRGALAVANRIQPDIAIVLDMSIAGATQLFRLAGVVEFKLTFGFFKRFFARNFATAGKWFHF
ncbi:MAG: hypothetical protein LBT01_01040 [Spirochaetaceae bacterium]|nr:hypothetical protein [Spirochaetaceae bacterium]